MNVYPLEQPKTENCFLEEAIDLLLLLEQELPQYINNGDHTVLENVIKIADKLKIGAEKFNLEAIFKSTNHLLEVLRYCLNNEVIVNDIIAQYLTNILESLQVLLMGYFIGSSVEEKKVLSKVENLVVEFNQYISEQQNNASNSINQETLDIETETLEIDTVNPEEDIILPEATSQNLTTDNIDHETKDLVTETPEIDTANSQEDIIISEATSQNVTPPDTDPETKDLVSETSEIDTVNPEEDIVIPEESYQNLTTDNIELETKETVVTNRPEIDTVNPEEDIVISEANTQNLTTDNIELETKDIETETPEIDTVNLEEDIVISEATTQNLTLPDPDQETRELVTETLESNTVNPEEDIVIPEETYQNLTTDNIELETKETVVTNRPEIDTVNPEEDIVISEANTQNLTTDNIELETKDLETETSEPVTSDSIEEIIPDENISDAISVTDNNPVVSNISNNVLEVIKESSVSETPQIQENDLLVKTILDSNQQNTLSNVNSKDLEKIGTLLDSLLNNNKLQTDTDINQEKNLKKISNQLKKIQPLLEQITTCSQQLRNCQQKTKVFNDSYSDLLNNSVDSVLAEISELASTFETLKANQRNKEQMNYEQQKLLSCSNNILNQVNNISFEELLQPLQNIWSQLQKLHHKTAILNIITPHSTVEKQLGEKVYTILLCFCCYLLEESLESETIRENLGKDTIGTITIESHKQNNNLIINISDDGRGLFLYPKTVLKSSINSTVNTQYFTTTFSELFLESKIFSEPEHYLPEISAMAVREIRQQLQGLEGTLNISSTPQQGTNITINICLQETTEEVVFFEKNSFVYALVLSSVKQIIFPRIAKVVDTGKESNLILPNRAKTKIPIIQIEPIVAICSDLVDKVQQPESESQNADHKEQTYIIVGDLSKAEAWSDHNQNYAIEINRFLGKETVVINSLESQQEIPSYIVGTTTYKDNQSVLVLNGSLIDPTIALTIESKQ